MNPNCVTEAMCQLILLYARQLLSKDSDINGEEEGRRSAVVYVEVVESIEVWKYLDVWVVPKGLPAMQTILSHILYDLSIYFREKEWPKKAGSIPANQWSGK